MSEEKPKYLKKKGAPDNDYHVYTDALWERGDMEPYIPFVKGPIPPSLLIEEPPTPNKKVKARDYIDPAVLVN